MSPSVAATCSRSASSSCSARSWWKTSARRLYDSIPPALGAGGGTARRGPSCRAGEEEDIAAQETSRCAACYDIPRSGVEARLGTVPDWLRAPLQSQIRQLHSLSTRLLRPVPGD